MYCITMVTILDIISFHLQSPGMLVAVLVPNGNIEYGAPRVGVSLRGRRRGIEIE